MKEIVQAQKELYKSGGTLPEDFRRLQLEKLRKGVLKYQDEIGEALRRDLNKSEFETYETETGMVLEEISCMLKHLHKLMAKAGDDPDRSFPVHQQNLQRALWFGADHGAVELSAAAGTGASVRMSGSGKLCGGQAVHYSPATSAVKKKKNHHHGEPPNTSRWWKADGRSIRICWISLLTIFSSPAAMTVGKLVMEKAAQHLTR